MRRARSTAHRAVLLALTAVLVGACADVLGISGYTDAIEELCGVCTKLPDCRARLEEKLVAASQPEVEAWLTHYKDLGCDQSDCNTTGLECFYTAPDNCGGAGAACTVSQACCGFYDNPRAGRCCALGDGGMCCKECGSCGEALGQNSLFPGDNQPNVDGMCLSQKDALLAVFDCRDASCKTACNTTKLACDACMTNDCTLICKTPGPACDECKQKPTCKPQIDACNSAKTP